MRSMNTDSYSFVAEETASTGNGCDSQNKRKSQATAVCTACLQEIKERFFLRVNPNLEFHVKCLKCTLCKRFLDESHKIHVRDGKIYCKEDFRKHFLQKCRRCNEPVNKTDIVMKVFNVVFHTNCFACHLCDRKFTKGEEYYFNDGDLRCRPDCESTNSIPQPSSIKTEVFGRDEEDWESSTLTSLDNQVTSTPPLSLRSPKSNEVVTTFHNSNGSGTVKKHKKDKQATRVRTVLNEKQLMTLKSCYATNSRPDALMKEHLVEMTGLSARVIRVWFQNKRCKDKKRQIALKNMQEKAEAERAIAGVRMTGVGPLVVASPTPHNDPNLAGIQQVDISQYQQNPAMWASMEHMDTQRVVPQPIPLAPQMQPNAYMTHMQTFADLGSDVNGYGIIANHFQMNMETDLDYSPQINASDLSSPCSEDK